MWKSILLVSILALLLNPRLRSDQFDSGCIIEAPVEYVRSKVMDRDFMLQIIELSEDPHLVAVSFAEPSQRSIQAARVRDKLTVNRTTGIERTGRVTRNSPGRFSFDEDWPLLQRVRHSLYFTEWEHKPDHTVFEHVRTWESGLILSLLHGQTWLGSLTPPGMGTKMRMHGNELIRQMVNLVYAEDKKTTGSTPLKVQMVYEDSQKVTEESQDS